MLLACSYIVIISSTARAQGVDNADDQIVDTVDELDNSNVILVTARKREESAQDVATSLRVFSGEQAAELGVDQPIDVARLTPGLSAKFAQGFENPVFTMRGVGLNDVSSINNPTVGIYIDDIFVPYVPMMSGSLFDIERIEVLKGPQGSLYGRNTTGGAIKFISRKPTDYLSVDARAQYSSWSTFEGEIGIGGPISDTLNGRVAMQTRQRQSGYQFNRFSGETVGKESRLAGRALLDWEPTDKFNAELNVHGYRNVSDAALREHIGFRDPDTGERPCPAVLMGERGACTDLQGYVDTDGDPFAGDFDNFYGDTIESEAWGSNLTLNYDLDFATLTSVTGYDAFKRHLVDDNDASPFVQFEYDANDDIEVFSQELRLTSNASTGIKYVAGLFYSWDNTYGVYEQAVDDLFSTRVRVTNDQTTESSAAFANVEIPLGEAFAINGGIRLTYETKTLSTKSEDLASLGNISVLNPTGGPFVFIDGTKSIKETDLSGNIGLQYRPSPDFMIYANAAKGFKSGGFKGAISFNPSQFTPYDPEHLYAYELGFKSTLLDGSLIFNAAAYYYDWQDFQAYTLVQLNVPVVVLTNAGDAEVKGVEGELMWRPSRSFSLSVAANYMDAKIVKFNTLSGGTDSTGNQLANAPDFTLSAVGRYTLPRVGKFDPYIQLQTSYQSKVYFELLNNPINSEDSYWLFDARIGLTTIDDRWEIAAFARNIFDKRYVAESRYIDLRTFPSSNVYGEPRSFGVSATFTY